MNVDTRICALILVRAVPECNKNLKWHETCEPKTFQKSRNSILTTQFCTVMDSVENGL